jgi:hypothetical protein
MPSPGGVSGHRQIGSNPVDEVNSDSYFDRLTEGAWLRLAVASAEGWESRPRAAITNASEARGSDVDSTGTL